MGAFTILMTLQWVGRLFLVLVIFAFSFFAALFVVGSIAERLELNKKMGEKMSNYLIYFLAGILYLLFLILALIPWARFLLK